MHYSSNINNKLHEHSQQKYSCMHCFKSYTRKLSYDRHVILCEVLHQTKRIRICEKEESTDIPSHAQLYHIVQELALKIVY